MNNIRSANATGLKGMLICGIVSSLLYIAMNIFIPPLYSGYDSASQTVSELSAIGAPTRALWVSLSLIYVLLTIVFAWGILNAASNNKHLLFTGWLIFTYACISLLWPFAPMHQRQALAMGKGSLTDTMHIVLSIVTICLMTAAMVFGARSFGKRFLLYSVATIFILYLFGILTFLDASDMEANLSTPLMGIWERISIGAYLVWLMVLATMTLRYRRKKVSNAKVKSIVTAISLLALWGIPTMAQEKDSVTTLPEVVITSPLKISDELNKSFSGKFPEATDVVWRKLNKDYLTKFIQIDLRHQALFRKNGSLKYDIIYMGESHLPKMIADKINSHYDAYTVTNAARINRAEQIFWIINLEGVRSYKVIRIDENGEMEEVKHYLKRSDK
jgi:hypothetical protein